MSADDSGIGDVEIFGGVVAPACVGTCSCLEEKLVVDVEEDNGWLVLTMVMSLKDRGPKSHDGPWSSLLHPGHC